MAVGLIVSKFTKHSGHFANFDVPARSSSRQVVVRFILFIYLYIWALHNGVI